MINYPKINSGKIAIRRILEADKSRTRKRNKSKETLRITRSKTAYNIMEKESSRPHVNTLLKVSAHPGKTLAVVPLKK